MARHVPGRREAKRPRAIPVMIKTHDEVRCDRAEADIEAAPLREERHERVDHVGPVREDLEHDVGDEERESAERDGTVHGLGDDPVARGHHDTVRGHDPDADRRCQRDQCEHARVEQHEVLGGEEDIAPARGDPGGSRASDHYQQRDYDQDYDVATLGSLDPGHREVGHEGVYRHAWTTLFSSWRDGSNADHYLEASAADHLGRLCPEDPCLSRADHDVTVPHYGFAAKLAIRRHNAVFTQVSRWFARCGQGWPTSAARVSVRCHRTTRLAVSPAGQTAGMRD